MPLSILTSLRFDSFQANRSDEFLATVLKYSEYLYEFTVLLHYIALVLSKWCRH
jgi:hypothetical protein